MNSPSPPMGAQAVAHFEECHPASAGSRNLGSQFAEVPGFEVLGRIGKQPAHRDFDVVILSSANESTQRASAQSLGVREYFHKPGSFPDYHQLTKQGKPSDGS